MVLFSNLHANVLPHLKYLGIQCPKGFSQSECLDNCTLLRLIGWTKAQLIPPLQTLKVWEGRGTTDDIVVDYISTGYLDEHLGRSGKEYDQIVVRGMVTKCVFINADVIPAFQLHSTILFRQLQEFVVSLALDYSTNHDIPILPYLEQIKRLEIWDGIIPVYPLKIDLPLTRTLQWLKLDFSTSFWMIGRSFKALREFEFYERPTFHELPEGHKGLQVDLPLCTTLKWRGSEGFLQLLSCPNVQIFHLQEGAMWSILVDGVPQSLTKVLFNFPCLKQLVIRTFMDGCLAHPLLRLVLCEARKRGVWRDIRSVDVMIRGTAFSSGIILSEAVEHQQDYEKWWEKVKVTKENANLITINASI